MKRKSTTVLVLVLSLWAILELSGCVSGGKDPGASAPSQPGSGPDTLMAVFTARGVTGTLRLTAATMQSLRAGQPGSSSDTLILYMTKRVCQPGSSSDTCYEVTNYNFK